MRVNLEIYLKMYMTCMVIVIMIAFCFLFLLFNAYVHTYTHARIDINIYTHTYAYIYICLRRAAVQSSPGCLVARRVQGGSGPGAPQPFVTPRPRAELFTGLPWASFLLLLLKSPSPFIFDRDSVTLLVKQGWCSEIHKWRGDVDF